MEDVFIDEEYRGRGIGSKLVRAVIEEARNSGCYKLICTSRHEKPDVHSLYEKLGFKNHGLELISRSYNKIPTLLDFLYLLIFFLNFY